MCSKKRESKKSFMCEHLEQWHFLGLKCRVWTHHPLLPRAGTDLGMGSSSPATMCGLECWSRNSQEMGHSETSELLIISGKHWECPQNSDSTGRARHAPQLGTAASFNVHFCLTNVTECVSPIHFALKYRVCIKTSSSCGSLVWEFVFPSLELLQT